MNDLENVVTTRLHALADDLTPPSDAERQVTGARRRHRRQRRTRIAVGGAITLAAAALVGLPTATGMLSAPPDGDVAGPTPTSSTAGPSGARDHEARAQTSRWDDLLDARAERDAQLRPSADRLVAAFAARTTPLALSGPPAAGACPDWAGALSSALGVPLSDAGELPTGCRWSSDGGIAVDLAFVPGVTREQLHHDVNAEVLRDDCYVTALPQVTSLTALVLCEDDGGSSWRLRIGDHSQEGVWRLSTTFEGRYPGDPVDAVIAVVGVADGTW